MLGVYKPIPTSKYRIIKKSDERMKLICTTLICNRGSTKKMVAVATIQYHLQSI